MPMIIQTVKFKSALSEEEVRRVMEERAPQFHALPGTGRVLRVALSGGR
jgi:hypothetical protein